MSSLADLSDCAILDLLRSSSLKQHALEKHLSPERAVRLRSSYLLVDQPVQDSIPYAGLDYATTSRYS